MYTVTPARCIRFSRYVLYENLNERELRHFQNEQQTWKNNYDLAAAV